MQIPNCMMMKQLRKEELIIDCLLQLIKSQTEEQQRELKSTKVRIVTEENKLKQNISHIKFEAIKLFLDRRIDKTETEMREKKQHRKLCELYGAEWRYRAYQNCKILNHQSIR